jgi:phage FluMu protein gp41
VADLVLDYALLHSLAGSLRELKSKVQFDVETGSRRAVVTSEGTIVDSSQVGNSTLYGTLSAFFAACHTPFKDSMELLDELANTFDSIAKAYFDLDADVAGKVNLDRLRSSISGWQADTAAYERYLDLKDREITFTYYDKDGNLVTGSVPVWSGDPVPKPGEPPTSIAGTGPVGSNNTTAVLDDDGNITSETTTVTSGDGLTYTETTTFTYRDTDGDGKTDVVDYTTTITHSDGMEEKIEKKTNDDGSFVVTSTTSEGTTTSTVTPTANGGSSQVTVDPEGQTTTTEIVMNEDGTGTKTVVGPDGTKTYHIDDKTKLWTLVSEESSEDEYTPYTTVTI